MSSGARSQRVPLSREVSTETEFHIKQEPIEIEADDFPQVDNHASIVEPEVSSRRTLRPRSNIQKPKKTLEQAKDNLEAFKKGRKRNSKRTTSSKKPKPLRNSSISFKCPEIGCDCSFLSAKKLESHLTRRHQSNTLEKLAKPALGKKIEAVDISGIEIRIEKSAQKDGGKTLYKCSRCKTQFLKRSSAEAHIATVHVEVKRFTCSVCGWGFRRSRDLEEHIRVHTGERPYGCPVEGCEYTSAWCTTVYRHVRRHHKHYDGELTPKTVTRARASPPEEGMDAVASPEVMEEEDEPSEAENDVREESSTDVTTIEVNPALVDPMADIPEIEDDDFAEKLSPFEETNITNSSGSQYTCNICCTDFEQLLNIRRHLKKDHSEVKKRSCNFCGIAMSNISNLTAHVRIHTGERPFKCGSCDADFVTVSDLRRHGRRFKHAHDHAPTRVHPCIICDRKCRSFQELENHVADRHMVESNLIPIVDDSEDVARLTPYEAAKIKLSSDSDGSNQIFTCNICDQRLESLLSAQHHVVNEHKEVKSLSCIYCGFTAKARSAMLTHTKLHSDSSKLYKCSTLLCDYTTKLFRELKEHVRNCTQTKELEQLDPIIVSNAVGTKPENALSHFERASITTTTDADGSEILKCAICWQEFAHLRILRDHLKTEHRKPTDRYACQHCENFFPDADTLAQHVAGHKEAEPIRCTIDGCQFTMVTEEDRQKHRRWHEKKANPRPKPFVCGTCGKHFEIKTSLTRHKIKKHLSR